MIQNPTSGSLYPKHIAIIMDGNGRWAKLRNQPRVFGHRRGVETVRKVIRSCSENKISYLTLFAFSSENWRRPDKEVNLLMELFVTTLEKDIQEIHKNGVQLKILGDHTKFNLRLQNAIKTAQDLTKNNHKMVLSIAANYGGRWDIANAIKKIINDVKYGVIDISQIDEPMVASQLITADLPDPDLFIRTGGDYRISNFLLWQLAYTELYFTDTYWPDFNENEFTKALEEFSSRQRRFGLTSEQVE